MKNRDGGEELRSDAIADDTIDLAEWIIPAGESEGGEKEQAEAQPQPVSAIIIVEESPALLSDPSTEPIELSNGGERLPFIGIPTTPASPRRTRHYDRENLGQLAFDFGGGEPRDENARVGACAEKRE